MAEMALTLGSVGLGGLSGYFSDPWLLSAAILVIGAIASKAAGFFLEKVVKKMTEKTETKLDDIIVEKSKTPIARIVFLLFVGFAVAVDPFNSPELVGVANNIIMPLIILIASMWIADVSVLLVSEWGMKWAASTDTDLDDAILPIFEKTLALVIYLIAGVIILSQWGIDVAPILAGMGIAGLAISLALNDSLKNIVGGITLMLDQTFRVGDKIRIESGEVGEIEDVGLRSTKLRTYDHELIIIPNGYLANSRIKNFTKPDHRIRVVVDFGVAYGSDVKKVKKTVMDVLDGIEGKLADPAPVVEFISMGDFALSFCAKFWIPNYADQYSKKIEAVEKIHEGLVKNGFEIPFPTRTVYLKK